MNKKFKSFFIATIIITITFTLLSFTSCEKLVEPIDQIELGRRDYTWEEDTLNVPQHNSVSYRDIVGNSPEEIWLGSLEPGLWYYDSEKWEGFEFPGVTPSALWLFEDNTLWVGTRQELILKRENGVWTESHPLSYEDYDWINIFGMYGKENNDIYAVGMVTKIKVLGEEYVSKGIILHYDGNDWQFLEIPNLEEIDLNSIHYQENIDTYFIWGIKYDDGVVLDKLFTFEDENLTEILSTSGSISLSTVKGIVYINNNYEVYKYSNKKLVLWKDFAGTDFLSNFTGRSENDFFNNSTEGLGHYNGKDYVTIYPTHLDLYTRIVFEKEVFITARSSDFRKYIIIHGTLKE